jgi:presenilin-like A22 family membrane protease
MDAFAYLMVGIVSTVLGIHFFTMIFGEKPKWYYALLSAGCISMGIYFLNLPAVEGMMIPFIKG